MKNAEIILMEQVKLLEEGVLKEKEDGSIQPIHTYQAWRKLGFQVRKGEKAVAKFPVWKYLNGKKEETEEEEEKAHGRMYMKLSAFFTDEQVDKIAQ